MFEVFLDKQPNKFLEKCDSQLYNRLIEKMKKLKDEPVPQDAKRIVGRGEPVFRVRVGKYRILYRINYSENKIIIVEIDHRDRVYN
jgi:mRNA interferase RelE/StbE